MLRQRSGAALPCCPQVRRGLGTAHSFLGLEKGAPEAILVLPATPLPQVSRHRAQNGGEGRGRGTGEAFALEMGRDEAAPLPLAMPFPLGTQV